MAETIEVKLLLTEVQNNTRKIDQMNKSVGKLEGGLKSGVSQLKNFAAGIGVAFAVQKVLEFGKALFDVAANMDIVARKAQQVLGTSFAFVSEEATRLAKSLNLTNTEFIQSVTNSADLLKPLGFTAKKAAEVGIEMTKLSGALSAWSGGSRTATEVTDVLNKALLGEVESLKTMGVVIQQGDKAFKDLVATKSADEGITMKQSKALVIFEEIQRQSADALASFEKNQNSILNTKAKAETFWRSMKESVASFVTEGVDQLALLPRSFELMWLEVKKAMDGLPGIEEQTINYVEFADVILYADMRFKGLAQTVQEGSLVFDKSNGAIVGSTEKVTEAAKNLYAGLVTTYGKEQGQAIFVEFTKAVVDNTNKQIAAEEAAANAFKQGNEEKGRVAIKSAKKITSISAKVVDEQVDDLDRLKGHTLKLQNELSDFWKDYFENVSEEQAQNAQIIKDEIYKTIAEVQNFMGAISDLQNVRTENELRALETRKSRELSIEGRTEEEKSAIQARYDKKEDDIKRKAFERNKKYAIAEATISAAVAVTKSFAAYASLPFVGQVLAITQAALITATAAIQIATISSQKYAKGGVLEGPSHAQGGILTPYGELEGGEGVITRGAMNNPSLRSMASTINQMGGGVPFAGSSSASFIDYDLLASKINDKKVYVVSSDVSTRQGIDSKVTDRAVF